MLTQNRLKECLEYHPSTGDFIWLWRDGISESVNQRDTGSKAGSSTSNGYIQICIDGINHLAHRLAFLYERGTIPDLVDHKDGNKANNRWDNLRAATNQQNGFNAGVSKANKSGRKGVCWDKRNQKWLVSIMVSGKSLFLGRFSVLDDAVKARQEAEEKYFGSYQRK